MADKHPRIGMKTVGQQGWYGRDAPYPKIGSGGGNNSTGERAVGIKDADGKWLKDSDKSYLIEPKGT